MEEQAPKRIAVVTGGNKGMGLEICRQLASNGVLVILTSRDEKRGVEAVQKLKVSGLSNVVYHQLDLKDSSSISSLADFIGTHFNKLDILVNNAADPGFVIDGEALREGLRALPHGLGDVEHDNPDMVNGFMEQTYEKAEEGLKTNYYGTKAVTEALLPFLQLSTSANIVNVSSSDGQLDVTHSRYSDLTCINVKSELDDVTNLTERRLDEILHKFLKDFRANALQENGWPVTISAYKVSKIAINAYTRMLASKFPSMRINCVHPGYVKTDMTCNTGILTAEEGTKAIVKLALLPEDGPSGQYFNQMKLSTF